MVVGGSGGGSVGLVKVYFTDQIFSLDAAVVKTQKLLSSNGRFRTNAMHHHRATKPRPTEITELLEANRLVVIETRNIFKKINGRRFLDMLLVFLTL